MGTRLRNGRVIDAGLSRTYDLLIGAKPQAEMIGRRAHVRWMARHAAATIDAGDLGRAPAPDHPLLVAWSALADAEREIRTTMRRNPDADFEFELWILPLSPRRTLMMVNAERREFSDWLDGLPFVRDHSYWDDTDRPDGVTSAAWRRREADWEAVLPRGVPSDRCLTLSMFDHATPRMPHAKEALEHIAPASERAVSHALVLHVDEIHRAMLEAERAADRAYEPGGSSSTSGRETPPRPIRPGARRSSPRPQPGCATSGATTSRHRADHHATGLTRPRHDRRRGRHEMQARPGCMNRPHELRTPLRRK